MRIVSLDPAATEVLFAVGLGDSVVGVAHDCDYPPEAADRPVVSASLVDTAELTSAEVDAAITEAAASGRSLYAIDADVWSEIEPDAVIVQETCEVCAVSTGDLKELERVRTVSAETVLFSPSTLEGILASIVDLGVRFGADAEADELTGGMRTRLRRVEAALAQVDSSPRVFVSEWLEPPFSAGHWVPDMVHLAGGTDVAGMSGEPSSRMRWPDVAALEPDVVVLAPCGLDLDRTLAELNPLELSAHLLGTPARRDSRVFAVDGNAYFSRPGPRVADGVEVLAHLLHPEAYPDPGLPWIRVGV